VNTRFITCTHWASEYIQGKHVSVEGLPIIINLDNVLVIRKSEVGDHASFQFVDGGSVVVWQSFKTVSAHLSSRLIS
jgi:hypothetical protein